MPEDRSLDEFVRRDGAASETAEIEDREGGDDDVEPISSTYVASTGECGDCGATVEERWRDGDELVCADCKDW